MFRMVRRVWPAAGAFLAAAALTAPAASPASAQGGASYTFEGAGWGHGVGMSQWGAYNQARADPSKKGEDIAAHYFPGSQPESLSGLSLPNGLLEELEAPLWINIASQISILEFTPVGGPVDLCLAGDGEGACPKSVQPQEGERWEFRRIDLGECGFFRGGELQGTPGECRASISWPEADGVRLRYGPDRLRPCNLSSAECEYRHGELKLRDDPVEVGFHAVLTIGLEDYVRGVGEITAAWSSPGVNEAQAVASRTYAVYKFLAHEVGPRSEANPNLDPGITPSRMDACWCHLYDNTRDQVYLGHWRQTEPTHSAWVKAAADTEGRVLTYRGPDWERYTKGGVIQAFFSASSGGITNSNQYGFFTGRNGAAPANRLWPYLAPAPDPWAVDPDWNNPHASWSRSVPASRIAGLLGWDEVTSVSLEAAPSLTSAARVRFEGSDGGRPASTSISGAWLRYRLGLKSSHVTAVDGRAAPPPDEPDPPAGPDEPAPPEEPDEEEDGAAKPGQTPDDELPYDELPEFDDIAGSVHEEGIKAIYDAGYTQGCSNDTFSYCPDEEVDRATMAAYLARALWPEGPPRRSETDIFGDIPERHPHAAAIYALAGSGITMGCGGGSNFCPRGTLTRGQMASFLMRSMGLEPLESLDGETFEDVPSSHAHGGAIYAIASEGVTVGCGGGARFCPDATLTRGHIATFLARAFIWRGPSPPSDGA